MILEGGELCLNLSNISFQSPLYVFWPREIGSTANCYCSLDFSTLYSFSDCYCIRLKLSDYTVNFNMSIAELCWKNIVSSMNGSTIGIVSEENADCGEQTQLTSRIFLKMMQMLIQRNTLETTSTIQALDSGKYDVIIYTCLGAHACTCKRGLYGSVFLCVCVCVCVLLLRVYLI